MGRSILEATEHDLPEKPSSSATLGVRRDNDGHKAVRQTATTEEREAWVMDTQEEVALMVVGAIASWAERNRVYTSNSASGQCTAGTPTTLDHSEVGECE